MHNRPFTSRLLAAGGFLEDDGSIGRGGMLIFDTEAGAEAQALIDNDPFTRAGVFERVEVLRWRKVFFDFRQVTSPDPFKPDPQP